MRVTITATVPDSPDYTAGDVAEAISARLDTIYPHEDQREVPLAVVGIVIG